MRQSEYHTKMIQCHCYVCQLSTDMNMHVIHHNHIVKYARTYHMMSCIVYQYIYLYDSICKRSLLCVKANKETWQTLHAEHPDTGPSASKLSETMHVLRDEVIPRTPENHTGNIKSCIHFLVSTVHEKKPIPTS